MSHAAWTCGFSMLLAIALLAPGCSQKPAADKRAEKTPQAEGPNDEIHKAMAELPEADRKLAEAQKICPVGGAALGTMGAPYKVMVKADDGAERTVFLCCEGCKGEIEKDPAKYLAKIDAEKK